VSLGQWSSFGHNAQALQPPPVLITAGPSKLQVSVSAGVLSPLCKSKIHAKTRRGGEDRCALKLSFSRFPKPRLSTFARRSSPEYPKPKMSKNMKINATVNQAMQFADHSKEQWDRFYVCPGEPDASPVLTVDSLLPRKKRRCSARRIQSGQDGS
jgi:hypothetical protein